MSRERRRWILGSCLVIAWVLLLSQGMTFTTPLPHHDPSPSPSLTPEPGPASPRCEDKYPQCPNWAKQMQCDANPRMMLTGCAKSCNTCNGRTRAPVLKTPRKAIDMASEMPRVEPSKIKQFKPPPRKPDCNLRDGSEVILQTKIKVEKRPTNVRVLCSIYTMESKHGSAVKAIRETWGPMCDGFLALSTVTDESIPSVSVLHEGPESYYNMWQKVRSGWAYIHQKFREEYDYFLIGGEDIYIIPDNLRTYLSSPEIENATANGTKPIFLGRRFKMPDKAHYVRGKPLIFNSGGASYVMNRAALSVLVDHLDDTECRAHLNAFYEDALVARCLALHGIEAYETRDELMQERFHPFTPSLMYHYRVRKDDDWFPKYSMPLKFGKKCCSVQSVSFHYITPPLMYMVHDLLYQCTPKNSWW